MLAFLLVFGLLGGWLLAGRMLAPLTRITDATRIAATGSLSHRIQLEGRNDEFRELADAFDTMLARLEAHIAEQQRFAANASHELRTPLAITQTLLDVARNDPNRDNGELVDRLHAVNTRAIDLTEALLLLSRADQRSFTPEHVDLSLDRGRGHRNAPPPRRETRPHDRDLRRPDPHHRLARAAAADDHEPRPQRDRPQPARTRHRVGHDQRSAQECGAHRREHRREAHPAARSATLAEPFLRGTERIRTDHAGVGLGLAIVKSITQAHDGTLTLTPRAAGGLRVTVQLPAAATADPAGDEARSRLSQSSAPAPCPHEERVVVRRAHAGT